MNPGPQRVEGVVLRPIRLGDSSKIVSALTTEYGRVKLVARGSRKLDSRLGPLLEPGNELEFVLYPHPDRELWTLSDATLRRAVLTTSPGLSKLSHLFAALELVDRLLPEREAVPEFDELCQAFLDRWHRLGEDAMGGLFFAFELGWLERAGLGIDPVRCAGCGGAIDPEGLVRWVASEGAFHCPRCGIGEGRWIDGTLTSTLHALSHALESDGQHESFALGAGEKPEIGRLLHEHMSMHLHGYRLPQALFWVAPRRDPDRT